MPYRDRHLGELTADFDAYERGWQDTAPMIREVSNDLDDIFEFFERDRAERDAAQGRT